MNVDDNDIRKKIMPNKFPTNIHTGIMLSGSQVIWAYDLDFHKRFFGTKFLPNKYQKRNNWSEIAHEHHTWITERQSKERVYMLTFFFIHCLLKRNIERVDSLKRQG